MILHRTIIHPFGNSQWVIHTPDDRNFFVDEKTYRLLLILQQCKEPSDALIEYNKEFYDNLSLEQFLKLIKDKYDCYNILDYGNIEERLELENNFLNYRLKLIPSKWASVLSKPLQVFYDSNIFWWAFGSCIVLVLMAFFTVKTNNIFQSIHYLQFILLVYVSTLFHELGHIGASDKYNVKQSGVELRFYNIIPVLYSNLLSIRFIAQKNRVIIKMAGVFNEMLYAAILSIIYLINNNSTFLAASIFISSIVIWKLNPFVRLDGYWVLSDLSTTSNLLRKGNEIFKNTILNYNFRNPFKSILIDKPEMFFVFMYGLLNFLFWAFLVGYTLCFLWDIVVSFPIIVWKLFQKVFDFTIQINDINRQLVLVSFFYLQLLRIVYNYFAVCLSNIKSSMGKPINIFKHEMQND